MRVEDDKPKFVRCSSLPLFRECASSAKNCDAPYAPTSPAAERGTAAHECLQHVAAGQTATVGAAVIEAVAAKYGVGVEDLTRLTHQGAEAWATLSQAMPGPVVCEHRLQADITGGTCDVLSHTEQACTLLDWKTGRMRGNARPQLMGYAYAYRHNHGMPACGYIDTYAVWLEHGDFDHWRFTSAELNEFAADFRKQVARIGEQYAPGSACGFCRAQDTCQAHTNWVTKMVEVAGGTGLMTPGKVAAVYVAAVELERIARRARDLAKEYVSMHTELPLPDGRVLRLEDRETRSYDPHKTWHTLTNRMGFTTEEIAAAITLQNGDLEALVKSKAARGQGAAAWREIQAVLSAAGAVTVSQSSVMIARKPPTK